MPNIRWLLALITMVHRTLYRVSGGRLGAKAGRANMLLLETIGRRSGRKRVIPLLYVDDGDRFAIVASNAGDDRPPAWLLNLRKHPAAEIQVGTRRIAVISHEASAAESEQLWPKLLSSYKYYSDYRTRTQRDIPIVVLEPAAPNANKL